MNILSSSGWSRDFKKVFIVEGVYTFISGNQVDDGLDARLLGLIAKPRRPNGRIIQLICNGGEKPPNGIGKAWSK
jgi:hypothetical protein